MTLVRQKIAGQVAVQPDMTVVRETSNGPADSGVCLVVPEDGVGFDLDGSGKAGGLGLINKRERVRQLNRMLSSRTSQDTEPR